MGAPGAIESESCGSGVETLDNVNSHTNINNRLQSRSSDLFIVLFLVQLVVAIGIIASSLYSYRDLLSYVGTATFLNDYVTTAVFITLVYCVVLSLMLVISWLWLRMLTKLTDFVLIMCAVIVIALCLAAAHFLLLKNIYAAATFVFVVVIIVIFSSIKLRIYLPFIKYLLKYSAAVVTGNGSVLLLSTFIVTLVAICIFLYGLAAYTLYSKQSYFHLAFCLFSFLWTSQVLRYTMHTTSSVIFSGWYFQVDEEERKLISSLRRVLRCSFGSICCGSLVSLITKSCSFFCPCFLLDLILFFVHKYAFIQIATLDKPYTVAVKDTAHFLRGRKVVILNDILIAGVNAVGCLTGGAMAALLTYSIMYMLNAPFDITIIGLSGLIVCCSMVLTMLDVMYSSESTLFFCFVSDPQRLKITKPEWCKALSDTYTGEYLLQLDQTSNCTV